MRANRENGVKVVSALGTFEVRNAVGPPDIHHDTHNKRPHRALNQGCKLFTYRLVLGDVFFLNSLNPVRVNWLYSPFVTF